MGIFKKKQVAIDDRKIIADLIVEEYRFMKSYSSAVNKLYMEERAKYISAFDFHLNRINEIAKSARFGVPQLEGKEYDVGLPVTPLNADEFNKEDVLLIQQVIEPAIISTEDGKIMRSGSVILAKKPQEEQFAEDKKGEQE